MSMTPQEIVSELDNHIVGQFDAKWLDQQGSFMAAIAAQPVFRLLGAKDLGRSDDYRTEKMPAVNVGLLDGQLAWRQHDGGHTDQPNWKYFIPWADQRLGRAPATHLLFEAGRGSARGGATAGGQHRPRVSGVRPRW